MSLAAVISVSTIETTSSSLHLTRSNHGGVAVVPKAAIKSSSCRNSASSNAIITYPSTTRKRRNCYSSHVRRFSPVMEWQHCTVKKEIDVPTSVAYQCYADREAIPNWMPFISSVKILEDKPDLSRWSLKYTAFGRDLEFAWIARNMQPILNQKIHWRSLEGLPNRGAVRFFPKGSSSCLVELTVSYEVPQLLAPVASALQPFLEGLLGRGLDRFATYVKSYSTDSTS